jgi:hypothetical protein
MKTAIFTVGVAIVATQIGCTWWLSKQPARLDESDLEMLRSGVSASVRSECYAKDIRQMLIATDRHESIGNWIQTRTNCIWDPSSRPDLNH